MTRMTPIGPDNQQENPVWLLYPVVPASSASSLELHNELNV